MAAQQKGGCHYSRRCWASAWATPMNRRCQRRSLRDFMFMLLLCKASPAILMAKGVQQWLCTTGTVTPEPSLFRKEAGGRRSRQAAEKSMGTWGDARRPFLPLVAFTEEPHMDSAQSPSSTPETMCPGKCKHLLCAFNTTVHSQLSPVSTPPLFNHHWHTWLVIWWSLDLLKPIATTLHGWCATPLCYLARPWWVVDLPNWTMAVSGERLSSWSMMIPCGISVSEPQTGKKDCPLAGV